MERREQSSDNPETEPGAIDQNVYEALDDAKVTHDKTLDDLNITDEDVVDMQIELADKKAVEDKKLEDTRKRLDETEYTPENSL